MSRDRLLRLIFSLVLPGSVAILRGRTLFGVVLLAVAVFGLNFSLIGLLGWWIHPNATVFSVISVIGVVTAVVVSFVWTWRVTSPRYCARREVRADRALALAYRSYLRGRLAEARVAVDGGLAVEPDDPELLHLRWRLIVEGSGETASSAWKRFRRSPGSEKWFNVIAREVEHP